MTRFLTQLLISLLLLSFPFDFSGQQKRKSSARPKTESAAGKTTSSGGKKATSGGKKKTGKKTSGKKSSGGKTSAKKGSDRSETDVRRDKRKTDTDIKETRRKLRLNADETSRKLSQLNLVEGEIEECGGRIKHISSRLDSINSKISTLNDSINRLDTHLRQITATYIKAVKRSQGRRQQMSVLAFIFSSDSFAQAYRRLRYLKQFEKWRARRAGEITAVRKVLDGKRARLSLLAGEAAKSKRQLDNEHAALVRKQRETAALVEELRSEGSSLRAVMTQQRKQAEALERELEIVIAREAAKREAARKAAEEAARKAAAEEAARRAAAEEAALRAAEEARIAADEKAAADGKKAEGDKKSKKKSKPAKPVKHDGKKDGKAGASPGGEPASTAAPLKTPDSAVEPVTASKTVATGVDFSSLQGKLAFPVTGRCTIVRRFGRQKHPSLPHVETNNAGIDLETAKGAAVRSVYDGEVSAVFRPDGYNSVVVIRHGTYMTVYANLGSVSVSTGQKVKAGQNIGTVYSDPNDNGRSVLHFEIRKGREKENPELWLRR